MQEKNTGIVAVEVLLDIIVLRNTDHTYGTIAKLLHWVLAVLIIAMISIGIYMSSLPSGDFKWKLYKLHKSTGILTLALVFLRFGWRITNIVPILPVMIPPWQRLASQITHYLLFLFMFVAPISGIVMSNFGGHPISFYGLFTIPPTAKIPAISSFSHELHVYVGYAWIGLISLHILAALYHHFILKDNVLKRMLR